MKSKIEIIASKRGYVVSEEGVLYNPKGEEIGFIEEGYLITKLKRKNISTRLRAHRLQAYQKYGDKIFDKEIVVRHLNGNPLDNSWNNILIGTNKDNQMDIPKQIRVKRSLHATSFVRKYDKEEVKLFYKENKSYKKTMEKFNISSKGTLHYILNN